MLTKILMLVIFFVMMIAIGIACRKHAKSVDGFVLGGRSVGAWFTAFAFGTSYFFALMGFSLPRCLRLFLRQGFIVT